MYIHSIAVRNIRIRAWMVVAAVVLAVIVSLVLTSSVYAAARKPGKKAKITTEHGFDAEEMMEEEGEGDDMRGQMDNRRRMQQGNFPGGEGFEGEGQDPEEMEARMQQQMKQRMFQGIRQGMKGMKMGVKQMNTMVTKLKKQGFEFPQEVTDALAKATTLVATVDGWKSAADVPDDFEDQMSEMQDVGDVLQEWGPKMGQVMETIGRLKGADKAMKQVTRELARVEKLATKVGKKLDIDLSDKVAALKALAAELKTLLDAAKAEKDIDAKLDAIEAFFDRMDEAGDEAKDTIELIEGLGNLGRYVSGLDRQVKQYNTVIQRLKKNKKVDVSTIEPLFTDLKAKLGEVKSALKQKTDLDTITGLLDELQELQGQLDEAIEAVTPPKQERRAPEGGQQYDFSGFKNLVPGGSNAPADDEEDEEDEE